jgi:hypothetical protein
MTDSCYLGATYNILKRFKFSIGSNDNELSQLTLKNNIKHLFPEKRQFRKILIISIVFRYI